MQISKVARTFVPGILPLAFGLLSLTGCEDSSEKESLERKVDLERSRAQQLEQKNEEVTSEVSRLSQSNVDLSKALQDLEASNADLNQKIDSKVREITEISSELDSSNKSLSEKNAKVNELTAAMKTKDEAVKSLEKELESQTSKVAAVEAEIARNTEIIADLRKAIDTNGDARTRELAEQLSAKVQENQILSTQLNGLKAEKDKISAKLVQSEEEFQKLKVAHSALAATLEEKSYAGVMALLENPGPESLFGVTDWVLRDTYDLEDKQDCLVIFNIDRNLESAAQDRTIAIPNVRGFNLVPLRTAYQKVVVCSQEGVVQAHKESGFIYKAAPSDNADRRALLTTRNESSCDQLSENVKTNNVFSTPLQIFYPYVGSVDGIETINVLRPSNQVLEYNMGSSHPGILASSCQALVASGTDSSLASTACRLAQGEKAESLNVSMGCFTETPNGTKTKLTFNK